MFLVCGEALFDVFVKDEGDAGSFDLNAQVGGSPFNVAIGMSRLGVPCALFTGVSNDLFGTRLNAVLEAEGVDRRYVVQTGRRTTLSIVGLNESGSPSYSFYGVGSADCSLTVQDLPIIDDSISGLHFGSYSIAVSPVAEALATLALHQKDQFISLDPNVRPTVEPDMKVWRRRVDALREVASLIKVSDEDLSYLYPESDPIDVIRRWSSAKLVVMTRGSNDVIAVRGDEQFLISPPPVTVVDTVGAGDAFQAALLAGLNEKSFDFSALSAKELEALINNAARAASITCTRRGADLPSSLEIT